MKLNITNQNNSERIARFIISIFIIPAPFILGFEAFSIIQASVGGILLFNALSGRCLIYRFFSVNTCKF
ncbi:MAG: DUF2892 domain-containing protein [Candidatus Marisimplicoccus sp.]